MSFGFAARGLAASAPCPCGSAETYAGCCGALHAGAPAPSAERLMRSRYTAFYLGDAAYLERTWHPRTRPPAVTIDASLVWTGLEIVAADEHDDTATVSFRASWRDDADRGVLAERSRFARRATCWFYLDGDVS